MTTFATSSSSGIVLSDTTLDNPSTIASGVTIANTGGSHNGDAVYGSAAADWTLSNYGAINATQSAADGVYLKAGGTITNASTGLIQSTGTAAGTSAAPTANVIDI